MPKFSKSPDCPADVGDMSDQTPRMGPDWKRLKEENKAKKRKWTEEKLIKKLKKQKQEQEKEKAAEDSNKGRDYTVSIALPGSILNNAQSPQLEMYLVGQIARAATVFCVDEIVVFDETCSMSSERMLDERDKRAQCCVKMGRILQYLECPQYLRKLLFPHHKDLQQAGLANPLDAPHHMREADTSEYREGVVLDKPVKAGTGSFVDIGLRQDCQIDVKLKPHSRVTVQMLNQPSQSDDSNSANKGKKLKGKAVPPSYPRTHAGLYWGYEVRLSNSLSRVWNDCPYTGGYDVIIGTSERGQSIDQFKLKPFRHLLIVFGGLKGLEMAVDADTELEGSDPSKVFPYYLNTCPGQGSRTIRTEEAILTTMASLRSMINCNRIS